MRRFHWRKLKRIRKRRIAQILVVIGIVVFVLRESRILWGVEGLEYFDLYYWGIWISDEIYSLQNLIGIVSGIIVLLWMSQNDSPKVVFRYIIHAPENFSGDTRRTHTSSEERRDKDQKSPLELVFTKDEEEKVSEETIEEKT